MYTGFVLAVLLLIFLVFFLNKMNIQRAGKNRAEEEIKNMRFAKLSPFGTVKNLSILPLVDYYAERDDLKTEPGVSYLVKADNTTILMDVGRNLESEHPSPLLTNMELLGVKIEDIDILFFSHIHLDHVGGMEEQKQGTFSISKGEVKLGEIPAYAPADISPSSWNPGPKVNTIREPTVLEPGIASIGVHPRYLFLMGYTLEHSLAINVKGKGIVLIVGCGHQKVERIIERAREIFHEPIYGIIGGLHYPIYGGRLMKGPLDLQYLTASDDPPWEGLKEEDVKNALKTIKKVNPQVIALSPHDSSDWTLEQFRQTFQEKYVDIKVGKEIII